MITRRNVVYAAVWLNNTLIGVAGLFLLQGAEFLSGVQVIVYIGGIMVLFLFVIMLVPVVHEKQESAYAGQWVVAIACTVAIGAQVSFFLWHGLKSFEIRDREPAEIGVMTSNSEQVGQALFSDYLLPFELASILLLVAIIGAIVMSKAPAGSER
jgi:NADH-quinone oxidoreductase subunit J